MMSASSSDSRPEAKLSPFVVPKVVVLDAGREDEIVVRHVASSQMNDALDLS